MSARDLAHLALRIAAIVIIVDVLTSLPLAFAAARYYVPSVITLDVLRTVLGPFALSLVIAGLVYIFAGPIADRFVIRRGPDETQDVLKLRGLEEAAVSVVGLYVTISGLAEAVHCIASYVASKFVLSGLYDIGPVTAYAPFATRDAASGAEALFRIVVGSLLLCNGAAFIRIRNRLGSARGGSP